MLTNEQKVVLRAEEEFRIEVRRELEARRPAASPGSRLWALLNSSFVLWMLSSVVVAGITAVYARSQNEYAAERERTERIRKLDTEIGNRIAQAMRRLVVDVQAAKQGSPYTPQGIYFNAARYLNNDFARDTKSTADFSIFPEFKTRTLRSLITELRTLVEPPHQAVLDRILLNYEHFADWGYTEDSRLAPSGAPNAQGADAAAKALRFLGSEMLRPRWIDADWAERSVKAP